MWLRALHLSLHVLHSAIKLLSLTSACIHGGCDFSVFDCLCREQCYLILMEPDEGKEGERRGSQSVQCHKKKS